MKILGATYLSGIILTVIFFYSLLNLVNTEEIKKERQSQEKIYLAIFEQEANGFQKLLNKGLIK